MKLKLKREVTRQFYHTKIGQKAWGICQKFVCGETGKRIVQKAYGQDFLEFRDSRELWRFPRVPISNDPVRSALFVMPFFGQDAASNCLLSHCRALKSLGYHVSVVFYTSKRWDFRSDAWDEAFVLRAAIPNYEKQVCDASGKIIDNGLRLDDWCGGDLIHFVAGLQALRHFDLCIVNYVFLSKVLEYLPDSTLKLIFTHDIMGERNSRMRSRGATEKAFYFSTSRAEEIIGLNRADLVIAIQENEATYFSSVVESRVKVAILPYLPENKTDSDSPSSNRFPVIGYFASGHGMNLVALQKFASNYHHKNPVLIGGSICDHISDLRLDSRYRPCGRVEKPDDFYSRCDLVINPDEFESGFKVKSIEALSFGKPLICTRAASIGLNSMSPYHHARDIHDLAILLEQALNTDGELARMANESIGIYEHLADTFDPVVFFERQIKDLHENISYRSGI